MNARGRLYWSCLRKIRHETEPRANRHVGPYYCKHCGGWHMSSKYAVSKAKKQNLKEGNHA
jgi:hypothetical protein